MVNMSEEESVSSNRRDKGGASSQHFFSPADADEKVFIKLTEPNYV
jgi:hypothetical protein